MNGKILIVDDEPMNIKPLEIFFTLKGYEIESAVNGSEALEKARSNPPEIIISDLLMPEMDGYTLCREWKRDNHLKNIPFIALTAAYSEKDDEVFARQIGVDEYIRKPVEPKVLVEIVESFRRDGRTGRVKAKKPLLEDEKEIFRRYNDRLVNKLGDKVRDLEREITERKKIEGALRESEEKYRAIFEESVDPILCMDEEKFLDCNDATVKMFGFNSKDEILNLRPSDLSPEIQPGGKNSETEARVLIDIARERGFHFFEWTHKKKNGELFPVEVSLTKIPLGEKYVLHGILRDVTERKKAENRLQRERDFNNTLIQLSPAYFVAIDNDGRIRMMNKAMLDSLGYSLEEVMGKDYLSLIVPESDRALLSDVFSQIIRNKKSTHNQNRIRTKAGKERLVDWYAKPLFIDQGETDYFFGVGIDITERQKAEEALKESEKKHRTLFETMVQGVIYLNTDGCIISANPAAGKILGVALDRMLGRNLNDPIRRTIHEDRSDFSTEEHPAMIALKTGKEVRDVVIGVYNPETDKYTWININAVPQFRRGEKNPYQVYTTISDITERRRFENQILQSQKMEAVGHLVAGVAHDFNNILAGLLGNAELGLMEAEMNRDNPEIASFFNDIITGANRAKDLIRQLLGFARKGKYDQQNMDINIVVKEVARLLERTLSYTVPYSVSYEIDAEDNINADGTQMHLVIQNLVVNARDAMPGGGAIRISTKDVNVTDRLEGRLGGIPKGNYVRLSVSDDGTGIDENTLTKIFNPYFTTKEKGKGTGLGLSTVYGIIKNHNGYIEVQTEKDRGTTFEIYFPAVQREEEGVSGNQICKKRGSGNILVVDDDEAIRNAVEVYLKKQSYRVEKAANAEDGLRRFNEGCFDLILTDLIMEPVSGLDFIRKIRGMDSRVKILLMSGYQEQEKVRKALTEGADGFIQKPFSLEEISGIVYFTLYEV